MKKLPVFCVLLALTAVAVLSNSAFAEFIPLGDLLFQDNYNVAGIVEDLNVDINSPTRVAGPLAGQVAYDTANMVGLKDIDGPNQKMDLSDGSQMLSRACVGLTKNFNNDLALGGFTVITTVNARGGIATLGAGHVGSAASSIGDTYFDGANYFAHPGFYGNVFGFELANLTTTAFAANNGAQWFSDFNFNGPYGDNYVELGLVFTDTIDNNPFNGEGEITAKMYVNGDLITTATGPDFTHNFISFQASTAQYISYKDLRIYGNAAAVPEPGTLALLAAAAGLGIVWFRRRR